jgi:hypothetical protein
VQFIGILAASFASIGINTSNNKFNGRKINQYRCSELLRDEMVIRRFYLYETLIHHNFVVFQTDSGHTFKVHLIADFDPGRYSPIYVEITRTYWKPAGKHVKKCNKKAWNLKRFVQYKIRKFGTYEVGLNDCRHFAQAVAAFLAI